VLLKIDETRATSAPARTRRRALRCRPAWPGCARWPKAPASSRPPPRAKTSAASSTRNAACTRCAAPSCRNLLSISQQQLAQRQQELSEMRARASAAERGLDLSAAGTQRTRPLLASGAVSEVDIIKLERDVSRSRGESEQAGPRSMRVQAAIGEAQRKVQETELTFRNEARGTGRIDGPAQRAERRARWR
jgi:membrane fusion protein, adhesin transport system